MQPCHVTSRTADIPPAHRCLPCLLGDDPAKRGCALRHLMAARLAPAAPQNTDRPQ